MPYVLRRWRGGDDNIRAWPRDFDYEHQDESCRHLYMNHVCIKRLALLKFFNEVMFSECALAVSCVWNWEDVMLLIPFSYSRFLVVFRLACISWRRRDIASYWTISRGNSLQMNELSSIKELLLPLEADIFFHMLFCEHVQDKPFWEIHVHLFLNMNYTTRTPAMKSVTRNSQNITQLKMMEPN